MSNYGRDKPFYRQSYEQSAWGIVVGRLQRERLIKYSMLNNLKEKYEIAV